MGSGLLGPDGRGRSQEASAGVPFEEVGAAHVARDGAHVLVPGHVHHTGPPWSQVEQVGGYAAVRLREIRLRFPTDCPGCIMGQPGG
jgi:hypothetical protein